MSSKDSAECADQPIQTGAPIPIGTADQLVEKWMEIVNKLGHEVPLEDAALLCAFPLAWTYERVDNEDNPEEERFVIELDRRMFPRHMWDPEA